MTLPGKNSRPKKLTPKKSPEPPLINCSFCKKSQTEVKKLVVGPDGICICDECIDLCGEILREENVPTFKEIKQGICNFCGCEKTAERDYLLVSHTGAICRECCGSLFMFWPKHEHEQLRREGVDVDWWKRDPAESAPVVEEKQPRGKRSKGK